MVCSYRALESNTTAIRGFSPIYLLSDLGLLTEGHDKIYHNLVFFVLGRIHITSLCMEYCFEPTESRL